MPAKATHSTRSTRQSAQSDHVELKPRGQALFDMANLRPERTGLPFVVFISQRGGARHDVRVKVAHGPKVRASEMITVAVRPRVRVVRGTLDPADLGQLTKWIDLNQAVLVAYWSGEIEYTEDAIRALKPLSTP